MRDFRVRNAQTVHDHSTGRKCDNKACGGALNDSIINFGENLKEEILEQAEDHSMRADLMLALGSSLRVNPAASLVELPAMNGGRLVIVNLQKTPKDYCCVLKIHAKIDDVFELLMKKLNMQIPEFNLNRWFNISM